MNYTTRARLAPLLAAFMFGAMCAVSLSFAIYIVYGRKAVEASGGQPALAESCIAFWFGSKPGVVFQEWERVCGKPGRK